MMVGCTTYTAPSGGTSTPVYIVKNQWGTGPNGAQTDLQPTLTVRSVTRVLRYPVARSAAQGGNFSGA